MLVLKAFWQKNCPRCPQMKTVTEELKQDGYVVEYYDLSTVDGLAEGAYHSVMSAPTLLLVDEDDQELAEWRGVVPSPDEVKREWAMM